MFQIKITYSPVFVDSLLNHFIPLEDKFVSNNPEEAFAFGIYIDETFLKNYDLEFKGEILEREKVKFFSAKFLHLHPSILWGLVFPKIDGYEIPELEEVIPINYIKNIHFIRNIKNGSF